MAIHGKGTVFQLGTSATPSTPSDISGKLFEVGFPEAIDTHEDTAFGASSKGYTVGLKSATISLSGRWDPAIDSHLAGLKGLVTPNNVAFVYGPEGSAATKTKYSGNAILTAYEKTSPVGDIVNFTAALQVTGDVTRGAF